MARARAALYRRYGEAAESIRFGGETIDRLTVLGRLATEPDPDDAPGAVRGAGAGLARRRRRRRRRAARTGGCSARAPRAGPSTARRSRRTPSALGPRAGIARGDAPLDPRGVAGGRSGPGRHRAVGLLVRRSGPLPDGSTGSVPADRLQVDQRRVPGGARRGSARPRDLATTSCRGPAVRRSRSRSRLGMGAWAADQPPTVRGRRGRRGSSRRTRRAASATCSSCSTRAATRCTWPRSGRARPSSTSRRRVPPILEGTADVLGWDVDEPAWQRRWLGEAAEPREALLSRYGAVMLDICWALFEIELHRHPERRPNDVWTEVTADGLGRRAAPRVVVVGHPRPAHRRPRLSRQLRAVGDHGGRGPGRIAEVRGPWFDGRPGLVSRSWPTPCSCRARRGHRRICSRRSSAARSPPNRCSPTCGERG